MKINKFLDYLRISQRMLFNREGPEDQRSCLLRQTAFKRQPRMLFKFNLKDEKYKISVIDFEFVVIIQV